MQFRYFYKISDAHDAQHYDDLVAVSIQRYDALDFADTSLWRKYLLIDLINTLPAASRFDHSVEFTNRLITQTVCILHDVAFFIVMIGLV